jgi:hypothetical protein
VRENVSHAQMYLLALALLAVAWSGWRGGRAAALGAPLGVLLVTKSATLMLWPLLLAKRAWRALGWSAAATLAIGLASLPLTGADSWTRYTSEAAHLTAEPLLGVTAFQTLLGFFRHFFGAGGPLVGEPLATLPALAFLLAVTSSLALLAACLLAAVRGRSGECVFAAFVLLGLMVSPVSTEAHYAMALLPLALLASEWLARGTPAREGALLLAGAFLITAPIPYRSALLADGFAALLAYPRLCGALLLLGLALVWSLRAGGGSFDAAGVNGRAARPS